MDAGDILHVITELLAGDGGVVDPRPPAPGTGSAAAVQAAIAAE